MSIQSYQTGKSKVTAIPCINKTLSCCRGNVKPKAHAAEAFERPIKTVTKVTRSSYELTLVFILSELIVLASTIAALWIRKSRK